MAKAKEALNENPFGEEFKEAQPGAFIKWETIGQTFKGTYKGCYEAENSITGVMQKIYEFVGEDGNDYRVGTRGDVFDRVMKSVIVGQTVGFLYAEEIPSKKKGNSPFKLIKIYKGNLDPTYKSVEEITEDIPFN